MLVQTPDTESIIRERELENRRLVGKTIQVTSAQVNAARLWIERADRDSTPIPEGIRKLANAAPRPVILHETTPTAVDASTGAEVLDGSR
jgi:hypothetical protein